MADAAALARAVRAPSPLHPPRPLVYNLSPSFNWMSAPGFSSPDRLRGFVWDLAREGFVLQLVSLAGVHSTAAATAELAPAFRERGMLAYVDLVQSREAALHCDVLTHQKWSGAEYVDGMVAAVQRGSSSGRSMGEGNTEGQFV